MNYETWKDQPFLNQIPKEKRVIELLRIVHNYLSYRNIEQSKKQKTEMVEFMFSDLFNMVYLKPCMIEWALKEYTDNRNNLISASIILDLIKKGYSSKEQKEFMNQWVKDQDTTKNLIASENQISTEEKNRQARLQDFEKCVEQVNNNQIDFNKGCWKNGIEYLKKDIKLELSKAEIENYNEQAKQIVKEDFKKIQNDLNSSREERQRSVIVLCDLMDNKITDEDIRNKIITIRQKMVLRNYIESMLVK